MTSNRKILAFGAHPDDIEFGCGAIIAAEVEAGLEAKLVVTSLGEASSSGTPKVRLKESENAAKILGASIEILELDGDSHLELKPGNSIKLAETIRRFKPSIVLAPTPYENQHPDHSKLGKLVRDAGRLARFGGLLELEYLTPHRVDSIFFYGVTPDTIPQSETPVYIDISSPSILNKWREAMEAHESQTSFDRYVELQLTHARLAGLVAGVEYAIPLIPSNPLIFRSLSEAGSGARHF